MVVTVTIGNYKVPFKDGNLLHYAGYGDFEWRDNVPFEATVSFVGMNSGRSAKYLTVRDEVTGTSYPMFVADTLSVLQYGNVSNGACTSWWCVQKRGQNYGLRMVNPDERKDSS